MGCFPACFGHWRHKETKKNVQDQCLSPSNELHESVKLLPVATESLKEEIVNPMKLVSESEVQCEEKMNISNETKAVFDNSNVKKGTNELSSSNSDGNENGKVEEEKNKGKDDDFESKISTRIPYSATQRNHDFLINDKDCVAVNSKEITTERCCCPVEEESSESLFSLSIDSRKHVFSSEVGEKEVSSPFKPNERENNTTRTEHFLVKTVEKTSLKYDEDYKENVPQSFDESKRKSDHQLKKRDGEIAVDTSLSSWLVEFEKLPQKTSIGNSPESEKNYGDRQIFGEMTPVEFKEMDESSSVGSMPCCSADNQLRIGMVGGYWRRGGLAGQAVDLDESVNVGVEV